jgi:hypothetical protein
MICCKTQCLDDFDTVVCLRSIGNADGGIGFGSKGISRLLSFSSSQCQQCPHIRYIL